jgi:single-strand DNA-binding protein
MIRSKNFVVIIGNLGRDPEIRKNENNTKTAIFSVATSEDRKTKEGEIKVHTEWHRVVAYRKLADMVETGLKKGHKVCVVAKLRSTSWEDKKTGEKKTGWSLEADDIFLHVRETSNNGEYMADEEASQVSDDDIPF